MEGREWCRDNVERLKVRWLDLNGYEENQVHQDCFFCHSTAPKRDWSDYDCRKCPARKIVRGFSCMSGDFHYQTMPRLFYAELKRLNKIRLAKK
jgi:hypothetical protein